MLDLALLASLAVLPAQIERIDQRHSQALLDLRVLARDLAAEARRGAVAEVVQALDRDPRLPPPLSTGADGYVLTVYQGRAAWRSASTGPSFDPASPGAIGGTTPAAGTFTTLTGSSLVAPSLDRATAGTLVLGGTATSVQLAAGVPLSFAAGSGGISGGSATGASNLPRGNLTWTGVAGSSATLTSPDGSVLNLGANAFLDGGSSARLWAQSGAANVEGTAGVTLKRAGTTILDVAAASSTAVQLGAGVSLSLAAGAGGLSCGSGTGAWTMPTGNGSWTGASNRTLTLTSAGISGNIAISAGGGGLLSLNSTYRVSLLYSSGERLRVDSDLTLRPLVTPPAGGSTSARVLFGDVAGFGIYYGTGAPTVSAAKGSLYLRDNGSGTGDRLYINIDGSTGWTAVTTAA